MQSNLLWVDKYSPKTLDDFVGSESIKEKLLNINHNTVILTGPCGTGKTVSMLILAKIILKDNLNNININDTCLNDTNLLQVNPSDDGGSKFLSIIDMLINFCKNKTSSKLKVILLDELDNMSKKVQQVVSNLIIEYKDNVKFIITCNSSSEILESIQSKSSDIVKFSKLDEDDVIEKLEYISKQENLKYSQEALKELYIISNGDMRFAINSLQKTSIGFDNITVENVYLLCDKPNPVIIKNLVLCCIKKEMKSSLLLLNNLREKGYSTSDIVLNMIATLKANDIILNTEILEATRIKFLDIVNKTCLHIMKGVDSDIQLTGCVAAMCL
jgi:DNA polymerase III delta prime subunit